MKISGYMICYNEVELIKLSTLNMLQFVDELILCDGDSEDGTKAILNDLSNMYSQIKVITVRQNDFRERNFQNGYNYVDGFNEVHRRNAALDSCTGDYILIKDIDELYHESFRPKALINSHPNYKSFCINQFEVIDEFNHLPEIRIIAHHNVPKLIVNNKYFRYNNSHNFDGYFRDEFRRFSKGVDCRLVDIKNNVMVSSILDKVNAFDMWHYKIALNQTRYNEIKAQNKRIEKLPYVPKEHKAFLNTIPKDKG